MPLIDKKDKIFIAGGATGMVGNSIKIKLQINGYGNLIYPSRNELDLTNSNLVFNWFKEKKPSAAAKEMKFILEVISGLD